MDCIIGVSLTVAVQIRRLVLCPVSVFTIRVSAAAAACCCLLLLPLPLHECLQSTRNQSRTSSVRTCVRANVRAYVRACGERKWMGDESRRRYNTDRTARPERLLNLSNEGSQHLSSGHGDGRGGQSTTIPRRPSSVPPAEDTVYLFIRSPTSFCYFNIVRLRIPG